MDKHSFLTILSEVLQSDRVLSFGTVLNELEEWDSLAKIVVRGIAETQFGKSPSLDAISACVSVGDLAALLGVAE